MDKWTINFKSLAYNICGVNTTNIQPINIKLINIVHNIHKLGSIKVRAPFFIIHNTIHKLSTHYPQIYFAYPLA
jgi:hypothetical protein